jgi:hypothetical protein
MSKHREGVLSLLLARSGRHEFVYRDVGALLPGRSRLDHVASQFSGMSALNRERAQRHDLEIAIEAVS